jgi:hypothetical protein
MVVAAMGCPNNTPDSDTNDLLIVNNLKVLEDANYWGHGPPPSPRKRSKDGPVFDVLPLTGTFDQTYHDDRPPPLSSKSKAKAKDKSKSTSKSNSTSKLTSASKSNTKSQLTLKSKDKDKENQPVCES